MTMWLGTPLRPGDDITVTYFGTSLHDVDGNPLEAFTTTLTTTPQN